MQEIFHSDKTYAVCVCVCVGNLSLRQDLCAVCVEERLMEMGGANDAISGQSRMTNPEKQVEVGKVGRGRLAQG